MFASTVPVGAHEHREAAIAVCLTHRSRGRRNLRALLPMINSWINSWSFKMLSLTLLLSLLSGCSSWVVSGYQEPDVRLLKVQVVKAKLLQQDFNLHFRVDNPNDRSVLVRGLRYKVMLKEAMLAEGESSDWFVVEGHGHKNFVVPIRTNLWQHLKYIAKLLKKPDQAIPYRLEGKLKTGFLFRHNVRIGRDGEIIPGDLIPE